MPNNSLCLKNIFRFYVMLRFFKHPVLTKLQQKKMRVDNSNGSDGKRKSDFSNRYYSDQCNFFITNKYNLFVKSKL